MTEDHAEGTSAAREGTPTEERLAASIAALDLRAELARLRDEEPWRRSGRHTRTLLKDDELRVVLIALRAGARLEEHHAPGRITIHALDGHLRVGVAGRSLDLAAGQLATIGPTIPHEVEALTESAFLLTIAWPA